MMRPALRTEDFNIEKKVIKEEIAMYKDQPNFDVMDRCRASFISRAIPAATASWEPKNQ